MQYAIHFKDGRKETIHADSYEESVDLHLFHRQNDAPFGGRFVLRALVTEVQEVEPPPKYDFKPWTA